MTGCCAVGCRNRSEHGHKMKRFPKDPVKRGQWALKVKRLAWTPTDSSMLCEEHFDEDQYETVDGKKVFKRYAIPTLFKHIPVGHKRKLPFKIENGESKKVLLDPNESNASNEIENLKRRLEEADSSISKLKMENLKLKTKLKVSNTLVSKLKRKRIPRCSCSTIFNVDQMKSLAGFHVKKWSNKTVQEALGLRFSCGTSGYESLLQKSFPYPSVRTLRRRLENIKFESGILEEVFAILKIKVSTFDNEIDKHCVLTLDEMAITEAIEYDVASKTYFGEATFPGHKGKANKALVFMICGIAARWKQAVAYYFTNGNLHGLTLKDIVTKVIIKSEDIGLKMISVTCDMGPGNQGMWRSFGIMSSRQKTIPHIIHPLDPSRKFFFLADVPHLLKNIRTSLFSNKYFRLPQFFVDRYCLSSREVNPKHIQQLTDYQEDLELKLVPKLSSDIFKNNHFDKMKVSNATKVLSHEVSVGLQFIAEEQQDDTLLTTAWFVKFVNKWFNLMTSRHPSLALSQMNMDKHEEAKTFLNEVIDAFQGLEIVGHNEKTTWKPIQTGVILSTLSILNIQSQLLGKGKYKFLLTARFTQDALENLFSTIRSKQVVPSALQFKNNLKLICIGQVMKKYKNGSYDADDMEFLNDASLLMFSKKSQVEAKIVLPKNWDKFPEKLENAELNTLYYISGYIMSRIYSLEKICDHCFSKVASKNVEMVDFSRLTSLKEYVEGVGNLFYVKKEIFESFFYRLEVLFRSVENYLMQRNQNCKGFIYDVVVADEQIKRISLPECHPIKIKIINRFISFRLKIFGKKKTKELARSAKLSCNSSMSSKSVGLRFLAGNLK